MKIIFGLFALLLLIVFGIAYFQGSPKIGFSLPTFGKSPTAKIQNQTFKLLLTKTPKEKEVGLSEKTSLPQDTGMLFSFDNADFYSFWMKNMKIPIDIIYINKNRVVTVFEDLPAPKSPDENLAIFKPDEPADKVLEINAGLSKKYGIKKGDEVTFENL